MKKKSKKIIIIASVVILVFIGLLIFLVNNNSEIPEEEIEISEETPQAINLPEIPDTLQLNELECSHFRYSDMLGYQATYSGEITNIGSYLEQFVKVHITFFANGEEVGTTDGYIESTSLLPGESSRFEGFANHLLGETDDCTIRVTSN